MEERRRRREGRSDGWSGMEEERGKHENEGRKQCSNDDIYDHALNVMRAFLGWLVAFVASIERFCT